MAIYPQKGSGDSVDREIPFSPELLYSLISDVRNIPRWSPECDDVTLSNPDQSITAGTRFVGHNHDPYMQWQTICEVEQAIPDRLFSFRIVSGVFLARTRWSYALEPRPRGSLVTESYEIIRSNPWPVRQMTMSKRHDSDTLRPQKLRNNLEVSLENLERYALELSREGT